MFKGAFVQSLFTNFRLSTRSQCGRDLLVYISQKSKRQKTKKKCKGTQRAK